MNIRRRDKARKDPPTEVEFLREDIRLLKQEIGILKQRGPTSIYAIDQSNYIDPIQGEVAINHPGSHPIASPASGLVYRHEDQWREVSAVKPVPWVRRAKGGANLTVGGQFLDDEETLGAGVGHAPTETVGSTDYATYFDFPLQYQIRCRVHGKYEIYAEVAWSTTFDGPSWLYLHDTVGGPVAMPTHDRPSGYGQLGSTLAGHWAIRSQAFKVLQVDVAQLSGANKIVDAWYIEVHYVGDYTGPERIDSVVWEQ